MKMNEITKLKHRIRHIEFNQEDIIQRQRDREKMIVDICMWVVFFVCGIGIGFLIWGS